MSEKISNSNIDILVVEDEAIIAADIQSNLEMLGFTVCGKASDSESAIRMAEELRPQVVLLDIALSEEMDGIEVAEYIREHLDSAVVFLTSFADPDRLERAKQTRPFGYLLKPYTSGDLKITVEMAVHLFNVESERRTAEQKLKSQRDLFSSVFDSAPYIMMLVNDEGRVEKINRHGVDFFHKEKGDLIGRLGGDVLNCLNSFDGDGCGRREDCLDCPVRGRIMDTLETGIPKLDEECSLAILDANGIETTVHFLISTVRMEVSDRHLVLTTLADISRQKQAVEEMQYSEDRFSKAFLEAPLLMTISNIDDGRYIEVNETFVKNSGYSREDAIGRSSVDLGFITPEDRSLLISTLRTQGNIKELELNLKKANGESMICLYSGELIQIGREKRLLSIAMDITGRKLADEKLERELRLNKVLARVANILIDPNLTISEIAIEVLNNARAVTESEHGYVSEVDRKTKASVGHTLTEMFGEACKVTGKSRRIEFPIGDDGLYPKLFGHSLNTGEAFYTNSPLDHPKSGGLPEGHIPISRFLSIPVKLGVEVVGQIALANSSREYNEWDIEAIRRLADLYALAIHRNRVQEDNRRVEEQLQQAQKMEAIGTLAGGIAHDFNNILAAMIGYTELAMMDVPADSQVMYNMEQVRSAGARAKSLVRQILNFSRAGSDEFHAFEVAPIVKEAAKFMRSSLPTTVSVRYDLPNEPIAVFGNPTQLHQVVMNLCTNAFHAMESNGGTLGIYLSEVTLDEMATRTLGLRPGRYSLLEISDTGHGMEKSTMDRIFDPFYTTKKRGEGTGLGLSVVYGIIQKHKGVIKVYSEVDKGSTFHVYLPLIEDQETVGSSGREPVLLETGTERILFVDDEVSLGELGKILFEKLGYSVTAVTSSLEALAHFKENPSEYDLVITDYTMPEMTGLELAREMISIRPELPIILCTGFSHQIDSDMVTSIGIRKMLLKPLMLEETATLVRELLDGKK